MRSSIEFSAPEHEQQESILCIALLTTFAGSVKDGRERERIRPLAETLDMGRDMAKDGA